MYVCVCVCVCVRLKASFCRYFSQVCVCCAAWATVVPDIWMTEMTWPFQFYRVIGLQESSAYSGENMNSQNWHHSRLMHDVSLASKRCVSNTLHTIWNLNDSLVNEFKQNCHWIFLVSSANVISLFQKYVSCLSGYCQLIEDTSTHKYWVKWMLQLRSKVYIPLSESAKC